ncbi:O-antigen ligase family protein [Methylocella sp.]|uniref:O-antigen ligase family protein n=1 Tax=Methylocella sp. TaxID=1978226 RepID=UPI0037831B17
MSAGAAVPALAAAPARATPRLAAVLRGAALYRAYLRAIPALWFLGALAPACALMLLRLASERWPRGKMINVIIASWFAIGLSQAAAAILNGVALGDYARGFANAAGFGVVGWGFGGLAVAAGAAHRLDDPRAVRAVAWVGLYMLILAGVAAVGHLLGRRALYIWPTPLGLLLPKSPTVTFYTAALIYQTEETLGELTTRLVLFFPWAPALGLGALAVTFISLLERNLLWRVLGVSGGAVATVFSWSRIAIAALAVVGALIVFMRAPRGMKLLVVGAGLCGLFALPLMGVDPIAEIAQIQDKANAARAGSSLARDLIYEKSYEGFLESPLIGHGWIGDSVHAKENLPIGSHSTVYGLLYMGGAPTFAAFVLAMALTFVGLVRRYLTLAADDPRRDGLIVALGLFLCLALYCRYEALFNLTLPCVFLFAFIGAALAPSAVAAPAALRDDPARPLSRAPERAARALDPIFSCRRSPAGPRRRTPHSGDESP